MSVGREVQSSSVFQKYHGSLR